MIPTPSQIEDWWAELPDLVRERLMDSPEGRIPPDMNDELWPRYEDFLHTSPPGLSLFLVEPVARFVARQATIRDVGRLAAEGDQHP
jgi:hypothetical protein